jgi:fructose-specific phosphotransferase system IIA component
VCRCGAPIGRKGSPSEVESDYGSEEGGETVAQKKKLEEYFDEELFVPEMKASSKKEALEELVDALAGTGKIHDKSLILEMLERREALGSTGIGNGVAIPHGRSLAANQIMVVFGKSSKGVEFDSMDGKPVNLFFLILAPPQDRFNQYLPFLGKVVELIKDGAVRARLAEVGSFQDFLKVLSEGQNDE